MWQVVGQSKAISLLKNSLAGGRLAHAYLLVGPPHVGKMTLALNLAQALNCAGAEPPCGECVSCQKITSGGHADVQVIGLASSHSSAENKLQVEISIDQVREVQRSASLPPFEGKSKVFIIDGAELLSTEAANCLLKTLEEPADKIVFVLLTVNDKLLPATVVSRCQRLELLPLTVTEIEAALNQRCGIELQRAKLLARFSHGCLGWAISAEADSSLLQQRTERIESLINVIKANYDERFAYAFRLATQFSQDRALAYDTLTLWLDWWHDLLLLKTGRNDTITNVNQKEALTEMTKSYSLSKIRDIISHIQMAKKQLRQNANAQLVLEALMLSIPRR